jgi:hypothetical protein
VALVSPTGNIVKPLAPSGVDPPTARSQAEVLKGRISDLLRKRRPLP